MYLHPIGAEPPSDSESDYHIVLGCGPLGFHWRISAKFFPTLPKQWTVNSEVIGKVFGEALNTRDPRRIARTIVHNALVDGQVCELPMTTMVASAIVWLLSTNDAALPLNMFHCLGYDISYVPGPPGQGRMFNFRAILVESWEQADLQMARDLPLPKWRPPPG